jgi:hypothetical protein
VQIQRNLQMRIEAQGKKLQKMFEEQLKASRTVMEPTEEEELQLRDAGGIGASAAFPGVGEQEGEDDAFDDVQLLSVASTGYNDARFPSKIS